MRYLWNQRGSREGVEKERNEEEESQLEIKRRTDKERNVKELASDK